MSCTSSAAGHDALLTRRAILLKRRSLESRHSCVIVRVTSWAPVESSTAGHACRLKCGLSAGHRTGTSQGRTAAPPPRVSHRGKDGRKIPAVFVTEHPAGALPWSPRTFTVLADKDSSCRGRPGPTPQLTQQTKHNQKRFLWDPARGEAARSRDFRSA